MSARSKKFVSGEFYHIYNRGNSKQKIFHDEEDYQRFTSLLFLSNKMKKFDIFDLRKYKNKNTYKHENNKPIVSIGSYCLMPNHFHILITQAESEENGISKFMHKLGTAYSMYYNKKYKRTGGLFEGKFKSQYIETDRHLKYLFSYIHLNPIKLIQKDWKEKGIVNRKEAISYLNNYLFSSYIDFMGEKRFENEIIDTWAFPKYFPKKESFIKETLNWLSYK
ncbi:MAG: transposase [Minisyncoccia bacterium]